MLHAFVIIFRKFELVFFPLLCMWSISLPTTTWQIHIHLRVNRCRRVVGFGDGVWWSLSKSMRRRRSHVYEIEVWCTQWDAILRNLSMHVDLTSFQVIDWNPSSNSIVTWKSLVSLVSWDIFLYIGIWVKCWDVGQAWWYGVQSLVGVQLFAWLLEMPFAACEIPRFCFRRCLKCAILHRFSSPLIYVCIVWTTRLCPLRIPSAFVLSFQFQAWPLSPCWFVGVVHSPQVQRGWMSRWSLPPSSFLNFGFPMRPPLLERGIVWSEECSRYVWQP